MLCVHTLLIGVLCYAGREAAYQADKQAELEACLANGDLMLPCKGYLHKGN